MIKSAHLHVHDHGTDQHNRPRPAGRGCGGAHSRKAQSPGGLITGLLHQVPLQHCQTVHCGLFDIEKKCRDREQTAEEEQTQQGSAPTTASNEAPQDRYLGAFSQPVHDQRSFQLERRVHA